MHTYQHLCFLMTTSVIAIFEKKIFVDIHIYLWSMQHKFLNFELTRVHFQILNNCDSKYLLGQLHELIVTYMDICGKLQLFIQKKTQILIFLLFSLFVKDSCLKLYFVFVSFQFMNKHIFE